MRAGAQQVGHQLGARHDQMLAIVEDQQQLQRLQVLGQQRCITFRA